MSSRERGSCLWTGLGLFWAFVGASLFLASFGFAIVLSILCWILAALCFIAGSSSDRSAHLSRELREVRDALQQQQAGAVREVTFCRKCLSELALGARECPACGWEVGRQRGPTQAQSIGYELGRGLRRLGQFFRGLFVVDDRR